MENKLHQTKLNFTPNVPRNNQKNVYRVIKKITRNTALKFAQVFDVGRRELR